MPLTRTVPSLRLFFFPSFSLLRYMSHRIGRIPCKRLRATLVEPAQRLLLSPGRFPADRHTATLVFARQSLGLADRRCCSDFFFHPSGFSSLSSFVTRTARRHDIASFHLQPHPLIPLVGVACNSSVPRKKIDVHRLCRLGAFFPNL